MEKIYEEEKRNTWKGECSLVCWGRVCENVIAMYGWNTTLLELIFVDTGMSSLEPHIARDLGPPSFPL